MAVATPDLSDAALAAPEERQATVRCWTVVALLLLVLLAAWQAASGHRYVASPGQSFATLVDGFSSGWLIRGLITTASIVGITFVVSFLAGTALGIMLGTNRYLREVVEPIVVSLYSVPKIILFPAFLFIFGLGVNSLLALGISAAIFPSIINASVAVQAINPIYLKVARAMSASPWQIVTKVYLPAIAFPLAVSLRLTFSISILSVVLGEMVSTGGGLGTEFFRAYTRFEIDRMYALFLLVALIALAGNLILMALQRRVRYD